MLFECTKNVCDVLFCGVIPEIRDSHPDPCVASGSKEVKITVAADLNALHAATKTEDEIPVNKGGWYPCVIQAGRNNIRPLRLCQCKKLLVSASNEMLAQPR